LLEISGIFINILMANFILHPVINNLQYLFYFCPLTCLQQTMSSSASSLPHSQMTKIGTFQGEDVLECQLRSSHADDAVLIFIMNFGSTIRDWQVPLGDGTNQRRSVVLGFPEFQHYPDKSPFFGAIVGRVANRIGGAKSVELKKNKLNGQSYRNSSFQNLK
jgi:hypothetical protein